MKPRIIVGVALSLVFAFTLTGAHEDNIASLTVIETGGKLSVNGSMLDSQTARNAARATASTSG